MSKKHEPKNEETELANLENQLKRALADYQNLEKRIAEEKTSWIKIANKDLILRFLPVLDILEKALRGAKASGESSEWLKGVEITISEFRRVLREEGLEEIEGDKFDPNLHEAIGVKPGPDGIILEVVRTGYILNGKLVRPAQVIVGKSATS